MIEITTLLLGMLVGPRAVAFAAAPQVASVVFEVDGRVVVGAVPEAGRGEVRVAFGEELMPHRLTAVAYDRLGREIGRDDQWINLPRSEIEAELVLHGDPWAPERASLVWEHLARDPVSLRRAVARLDGRELQVADPGDFELPPVDPDVPHVLSLELTFSNGERVELAEAFGGSGVEEIETRLLPLRVTTRDGQAWPADPETALGTCLAAPAGARVAGWEEGPGEVLVVPDLGALPLLDRMLESSFGRSRRTSGWVHRFEHLLPLGEGDVLRQVWPVPERVEHGTLSLTLFPSTDREHGTGRGMVSLLRTRHMVANGGEQRLADAVALAGFLAYGSGRPAAVVLVLGKGWKDASERSPAAVRAYLEALHVPLHVWTLGVDDLSAWGPAARLAHFGRLSEAVRELAEDLDRQRLVWLAGVSLPQEVRFADCACCLPAPAG